MHRSLFVLTAAATLVSFSACQSTKVSEPEGEDAAKISFTKEIKPIFKERCVMCHNAKTLPGKLSLESKSGAFADDQQGHPYIVAGKPEQSRLYISIIAPEFHDMAMPLVSHRVSKAEIEKIRQWIEQGADWPSGEEGKIVSDYKVLE